MQTFLNSQRSLHAFLKNACLSLVLLSLPGSRVFAQESASTSGISSLDYGAKGDGKVVGDAVVTAGSNTVTSATARWSAADVGKLIAIPYAGSDNGTKAIGKTFITAVVAVNSSTSVTLAAAPVKSIVGPRTINDGAMVKNTNVLTSTVASFTPGDIGKKITIPGVGLAISGSTSSPSTCWITAYTSATQVTVSRKALATVTKKTFTIPGATVYWGTDDTAALQAALNDSAAQQKTLRIEAGRYLITSTLTPANYAHVQGDGAGNSIISPVGSGFSIFTYSAKFDSPLTDFWVQDLELDGFGVTVNTYVTGSKALYCRPMLRPVFQNLYVHDTSATGIGCDFIRYGQIINNRFEHCGRQVPEFGNGAGGSGIGLGTGLYTIEPTTISGNNVSDCGNNGIFTESQTPDILSQGIRIFGNYCEWNTIGISDRACDGTVIQGNTCAYNDTAIALRGGFVNGTYSVNTLIRGNNCDNSFKNGMLLDFKSGAVTVQDNTITGTASGNGGILFDPSSPTSINLLNIQNNLIHDSTGWGIYINGNSDFDNVRIDGNTIWDFGVSSSTRWPAVRVSANIANLSMTRNTIYDTRTSTGRFSSYPLELVSGTYTNVIFDGNDVRNLFNSNSPSITGATLINPIISHFNP